MELEAGNIYVRKEVHAAFGGSQQGGITPTKDSNKVFIWSTPRLPRWLEQRR